MPRSRYRQDPLFQGDAAPPPQLYGPTQPLPAGLQHSEQGQLPLDGSSLGPLFAQQAEDPSPAECGP